MFKFTNLLLIKVFLGSYINCCTICHEEAPERLTFMEYCAKSGLRLENRCNCRCTYCEMCLSAIQKCPICRSKTTDYESDTESATSSGSDLSNFDIDSDVELQSIDLERVNVRELQVRSHESGLIRHDFIHACKDGVSERVDELLRENIGMSTKHKGLILACKHGKIDAVRKFFGQPRINFKIRNQYNQTLLFLASMPTGSSDLVKELLEKTDVELNYRSDGGVTALIRAIWSNSAESVKILLNQPGIDVNISDNWGKTALHYVARREPLNSYTARMLLEKSQVIISVSDYINLIGNYAIGSEHSSAIRRLLVKKLLFLR